MTISIYTLMHKLVSEEIKLETVDRAIFCTGVSFACISMNNWIMFCVPKANCTLLNNFLHPIWTVQCKLIMTEIIDLDHFPILLPCGKEECPFCMLFWFLQFLFLVQVLVLGSHNGLWLVCHRPERICTARWYIWYILICSAG